MSDKTVLIPAEYWFEVLRSGHTGPAWRQELELVFVLQGRGSLQLEDENARHEISVGNVFAINSFELRNLDLYPGAMVISLLLSPQFLSAVSPEKASPVLSCHSFRHGLDGQKPFNALRRQIASAFRAYYKKESPFSVHLRGRMTVLVDFLLSSFLAEPTQDVAISSRYRMRTVVDYINSNYREIITLQQLSEATFLSKTYLSRAFAKYLGVSITDYIKRLRVQCAATKLASKDKLIDISNDCGFSNVDSFIKAFKTFKGITPGQYRHKLQVPVASYRHDEENETEFSTVFAELMQYVEQPDSSVHKMRTSFHNIVIRADAEQQPLLHTWKRVINVGYAKDLLNGNIQSQINQLQSKVRFQYFRCKGILDDEMMICTQTLENGILYNFVYLDEIIDFILSCGAKPMLEIGHMPELLAKTVVSLSGRIGRIAAPTELSRWRDLIENVMNHLCQRYGVTELEQWLFTPWVSPDIEVFGFFSQEEFEDVYMISYRIIKDVSEKIKICATGNSFAMLPKLSQYLDFCLRQDCLPDILTLHSFNIEGSWEEKKDINLLKSDSAFSWAVTGDEQYLTNNLRRVRELLAEKGLDSMPVMLDEWSNNILQRDLCNDTCYKSAYLFKNILENYDLFYAMSYFSVCDRTDEIVPSSDVFSGGFGLFTYNGLPKSGLRAFELLSQAGDRLLAKGKGYFVSADSHETQIYLYNYSHYDTLYRYRHATNMTMTDRYNVLNDGVPRSYRIRLEMIEPGEHTVRRYRINEHGGSCFDAWVKMGAPKTLSSEEYRLLQNASFPLYHKKQVCTDRGMVIEATLAPLEVQLIILSR